MCGRYTLMKEKAELKDYFDAAMEDVKSFDPNYNIAPSHYMPVVGANKDDRELSSRSRMMELDFTKLVRPWGRFIIILKNYCTPVTTDYCGTNKRKAFASDQPAMARLLRRRIFQYADKRLLCTL
ncbi:MAG TPA: SOS response-associated peptidase family protein [Fodinibius sp.]|nr:SOS response-associated peptidase family protein [Fodinibius sp.]